MRKESSIPLGLCQCGCGQRTRISPETHKTHGYVKGQPRRYVNHHASRTPLNADPLAGKYTIEDRGYGTPCWIFLGSPSDDYGRLRYRGLNILAHVFAYTQKYGPLPPDTELDHLCRQTKCCNPDHVEPVSHNVNVQRGRRAKLTPEAVSDIRSAPKSVSNRALAARFGVSDVAVSYVRRGKVWKHID